MKILTKKQEEAQDQFVENLISNEERLNDLVNALNKENAALREGRPDREYNFTPITVTTEEQKIIGDFAEAPIIELLTKWFKSKADTNNDLLLHNSEGDPIKEAKFKVAVLMYDDWRMFIKNCQRQYEKET